MPSGKGTGRKGKKKNLVGEGAEVVVMTDTWAAARILTNYLVCTFTIDRRPLQRGEKGKRGGEKGKGAVEAEREGKQLSVRSENAVRIQIAFAFIAFSAPSPAAKEERAKQKQAYTREKRRGGRLSNWRIGKE